MERTQPLLDVDQLAVQLNVPKKTIYYWVSRNEIPYLKMGRHLRFDLHQIIQHFSEKTRTKSPGCSPIVGLLQRSDMAGRSVSRCSLASWDRGLAYNVKE